MIERTTFDLRIAEHGTTIEQINQGNWQHQGEPSRRPIRAALATLLIALATRLDSTLHGGKQTEQPAIA